MILTVPPHPCVWRLVSPVSMILRSAREGSVSDRVTTTGDTASEAAALLAVTGGGAAVVVEVVVALVSLPSALVDKSNKSFISRSSAAESSGSTCLWGLSNLSK